MATGSRIARSMVSTDFFRSLRASVARLSGESRSMRVVEAIAAVFRRFADLGTARQVLLSLPEHDLLAAKARRPVRLTDEELAWLSSAGADVQAVFTSSSTTFRERK